MKLVWLIYPFFSIFIITGAFLSYKTFSTIQKARAIENWPSAEAEIAYSKLIDTSDSESNSWEVEISYRYRVGGIDFENSSIHPGYSSSSADGHRGLYQKLSESKRVLAYYNPSDHSESYLITGNFGFHKAAFFGGLLFFSAGIFFMLTFHYAFTGSSNYADKLTVIQQVEQAEWSTLLHCASLRDHPQRSTK